MSIIIFFNQYLSVKYFNLDIGIEMSVPNGLIINSVYPQVNAPFLLIENEQSPFPNLNFVLLGVNRNDEFIYKKDNYVNLLRVNLTSFSVNDYSKLELGDSKNGLKLSYTFFDNNSMLQIKQIQYYFLIEDKGVLATCSMKVAEIKSGDEFCQQLMQSVKAIE